MTYVRRILSCGAVARKRNNPYQRSNEVFTPNFPILTMRLLLRPFVLDDLDDLCAIQGRDDVATYLYWSPRSRDEVRRVLAGRVGHGTFAHEGDNLVLAGVLRDTGQLIGEFHLRWLSEKHQRGEIGFIVHPDHHGRGYATEGSREMIRLGFEGLGLRRIIGRCDGRNSASAGLMERLGMRREAHLRENEFVKGEWTDEMIYAMLANEWSAAQTRRAPPAPSIP